MKTIVQLLLLTGFYLIGDWCRVQFRIPLPGSVIGFALVFLGLELKLLSSKWFENGSQLILKFLPLFFIPAAIRSFPSFQAIPQDRTAIVALSLITTVLILVFSGVFAHFLENRDRNKQ